jgi:hypothetical protein
MFGDAGCCLRLVRIPPHWTAEEDTSSVDIVLPEGAPKEDSSGGKAGTTVKVRGNLKTMRIQTVSRWQVSGEHLQGGIRTQEADCCMSAPLNR